VASTNQNHSCAAAPLQPTSTISIITNVTADITNENSGNLSVITSPYVFHTAWLGFEATRDDRRVIAFRFIPGRAAQGLGVRGMCRQVTMPGIGAGRLIASAPARLRVIAAAATAASVAIVARQSR
jgi:hypothetical protein